MIGMQCVMPLKHRGFLAQEQQFGEARACASKSSVVLSMADASRPTFLEILEKNNGQQSGMEPSCSSSVVLKRRLREGSGFTVGVESVEKIHSSSGHQFIRGREVFQQVKQRQDSDGVQTDGSAADGCCNEEATKVTDGSSADEEAKICVEEATKVTDGSSADEEAKICVEEAKMVFSSKLWKETTRKAFQGGVLGGSSKPNQKPGTSTAEDSDTRNFSQTKELEAAEKSVASEENRENKTAEDLLFKFLNDRKQVSKQKQDWKETRNIRRGVPGIYEVKEFPFKQSDLRTEGRPPFIKGPVYQSAVEKAFALVKNLKVNERLEDVLDSMAEDLDSRNGNLVMQALGERGYDSQALSCFQWMRTHEPCLLDEESYAVVFSLLRAADMADEALSLFNGMPEAATFHSMNTYNSLIQALAHCGRRDEIEAVMEKMQRRGLEPDSATFSTLITDAQKGRHSLKKVWELFQALKVKGCGLNITVYGNLVKAFCDEGRRTEALAVVSEMEKSGRSLSTVIYNTLIDAYAKAGEISEAEGLFEEMREKGFKPNVSTFNILISAYGKLGHPEVSETLMEQMQEIGLNLKPDVVTYSALISAYGRKKMAEQAANAFLRMKKQGIKPNSYAYTALIHAYSEGRWHEKAALAFQSMKREGIQPTVETYTALLNGYKQAGAIDEVKMVWKEMRGAGLGGSRITYNTLVDAFCKHGHYTDARAVIFEFKKLGVTPNLMTFNMLINAYARGGEEEKAEKILMEIKQAGFQADAYTYSTLIYAFLRVRDFENAFKYHNRMIKCGKLPDQETYAKLKLLIDEQAQKRIDNIAKAAVGQLDRLMSQGRRPPRTKLKRFWKTQY